MLGFGDNLEFLGWRRFRLGFEDFQQVLETDTDGLLKGDEI